ncbi:hypothetical protein NBH15_03660 [Parabacteroides sp. W1-Q-101]|uniref:hypothetical protein n=1 Tax=Parabacteroides caeci TaxID=2949650 RepID=UPI0020309740|nr:hypothetical protein [Parabacteroides sp. W1-Q-101]MCM0717367.1 hypothetical protein [Parabacteroides sp. W1-Q-101]
MNEKIGELRILLNDLETLIYTLSGSLRKTSLDGNGTVKEQINNYKTLGLDIQFVMKEIAEKYGDDITPSCDYYL